MTRLLLIFSVCILFISCSPSSAKVDNGLKKYFDSANVEGSFSLLNNQTGMITIYDMKADTERVSPGDIFKIAETIIALQTTRLTDSSSKLIVSDTGNVTMKLKDAFDKNDTTFFRKLQTKIGSQPMSAWVDSLHYGNLKTSDSAFWLNGELKISPDEQLGLMSKIYFDKLGVDKYAQQVVKDLMLKEDNTLYKFSYTTGSATGNKNQPMAWVCGWIEENLHVYFFTCIVSSKDQKTNLEQTGLSVTKNILKGMGFFQGKK